MMTQPPSPPPNGTISGHQRQYLRGLAHHKKSVVPVGQLGPTDAVLHAVRAALLAHELIKVRMHQPEDKRAVCEALAAGTQSTLCGLVGHTAILYRAHPTKPRIKLPSQTNS